MDMSDDHLERAERAGQEMLASEPRAASARYDRDANRVVIELTNGCSYAFPPALVQDLQGATSEQLTDVRIDGYGFNLNFPALDADLYVPALVSGIFGSRTWMTQALARLAGRRTSAAKAAAARTNGAKGGRPRKRAPG